MKRNKLIIVAFIVAGFVVIWFVAIDWSYFEEGCGNCLYHKSVYQYRVLGIPIHEKTTEYHSVIELVAQDLGVPCQHRGYYRTHRQRWWGLCYCRRPCIMGTTHIASDQEFWYTAEIKKTAKAMISENPAVGEEYRQRVVIEHDWEYWRNFVKRLKRDK